MSEIDLPSLALQRAPVPDRRIVATLAVSVVVHVLVFALVLILPLLKLPPPAAPEPVTVDIVTPEQFASLEPSSAPSSSAEPVSSEPPSSSTEAGSSEAPSAVSSAEVASSEVASSEQTASSAASVASAAEQASAAAAASSAEPVAPQPQPGRPVVIPVGPADGSSEAAAPASEAASSEGPSAALPGEADAPSVLGAEGDAAPGEADPGTEVAAAAPQIDGPLHVASQFYASRMLRAPELEAARAAIRKLPRARRIVQMCNLEALGQIGGTARRLKPDALVADAFAAPVAAGLDFTVPGGAFRSETIWYGISFSCTVAADLASITRFSFRIGAPLPGPPSRRVGAPAPAGP